MNCPGASEQRHWTKTLPIWKPFLSSSWWQWALNLELLVDQWWSMEVAGMIVKIVVGCYGSFPHFLLSTSKTWNSLAEPKETGYLVASGSRNNKGIDKTFDRVEVAPSTGPWAPHVVLHLLVTLAAKISDGNGYIWIVWGDLSIRHGIQSQQIYKNKYINTHIYNIIIGLTVWPKELHIKTEPIKMSV